MINYFCGWCARVAFDRRKHGVREKSIC